MTVARRASELRLLSDIGGTRIRFALSDRQGKLRGLQEFKTGEFLNFFASAESYLARFGEIGVRPSFAAIAVAGPVKEGAAQMTNVPWKVNSQEIKSALNLKSVRVVNDFEAQAHALPWLAKKDLEQIGGGKACDNACRVILGPGTGLGVAGLVSEGQNKFRAVPGEGGHMTLAAMNNVEADLIACLRDSVGHVSAERVLSGPGLEALYRVIAARDRAGGNSKTIAAEDMLFSVNTGNVTARKALLCFSQFLGTIAADLALIFWARGGVYLSGGVLKRLGPAFDREAFRTRFESKGRFSDRLAEIPTFLVKRSNPGLLGLAKMPMEVLTR